MKAMDMRSYKYKAKIWFGPLVILFFGACAIYAQHLALHSNRGVIINHLITLSPSQTAYFHWVLFVVSATFVVMGFVVFLAAFKPARLVTLDSTKIIAPKNGFSSKMIEVPYKSILSLTVQEIQRQKFLHIKYSSGKLTLVQSLLPSKSDFDEIYKLLAANTRLTR
jgi:hypothetical protein